jgi:glc operon protein GlcG
MKSKAVLEYADVQRIMSAATAAAVKHGWAVSIAIVDDGGHLLALHRLDGAAPLTAHIAPEKARTSALGGRESGSYEKMINEGRYAYLSVPLLQGLLEGGAPIVVDGQVIGAVGVSGVKSAEDLQVAKAGIEALAQS